MKNGKLAIKLSRGGFFEMETGSGVVSVVVVRLGDGAVTLAVQAPKDICITRDKLLAKRAEMRRESVRVGVEGDGREVVLVGDGGEAC
jgi:hypothetical protein